MFQPKKLRLNTFEVNGMKPTTFFTKTNAQFQFSFISFAQKKTDQNLWNENVFKRLKFSGRTFAQQNDSFAISWQTSRSQSYKTNLVFTKTNSVSQIP